MKRLASLALLVTADLSLAGCQSEAERTQAARNTMMNTCLPRAQAMAGVDANRFCNCVADRTAAEMSKGGAPDTAQIGTRCDAEARNGSSPGTL